MLRAAAAKNGFAAATTSRLPPCTCSWRLASTAAATRESNGEPRATSQPPTMMSSKPPSKLSRAPTPLYKASPLPPLPPPLPLDADQEITAPLYAASRLASAQSSANEQLAILDACLSSGDLPRAEQIMDRIQQNFLERERSTVKILAEILPPRVHADFLKAYLSTAIMPQRHHDSGTAEQHKKRFVTKAWAYWDALFERKWTAISASKRKSRAIDRSVVAVMLKGLTACGPALYNPSAESDPDGSIRPITALLPVIEMHDITLEQVMHDPIFQLELPSYLGKVDREHVLDALLETGKGRSRFDEWIARIDDARAFVREDDASLQRERESVQAIALQPTESDGREQPALTFLKTNLSTLDLGPSKSGLTMTARQRLLEESSYDAARQLYIHELEELAKVGKDKERGLQSDWLQTIMFDWLRDLRERLTSLSKDKKSPWSQPDVAPFLRLLPVDKLSLITIVELLRLCGGSGISDGMKAARAILTIGTAVEREHRAQALVAKHSSRDFWRELERIAHECTNSADGEQTARTIERSLAIFWRREREKEEAAGGQDWQPEWSSAIRARVGSVLVSNLMEVAKIKRVGRHPVTGETVEEVQPAFSHAYQYVRGTKLGIIRVNPAVAERLDNDPMHKTMHPRYLPMIVKPKPWLSWNSGCYLLHHTTLMRMRDAPEQVAHLKQASDADALEDIFTGLDTLGAVPWKVNQQVFDVASAVWNSGEAVADIPKRVPLTAPLDIPKVNLDDKDPRAKDNYRHRARVALQERRQNHSIRCDVNYKLEIARAFLSETFYFPHNLDFRGRAYPIPPNLSHLGNDLSRGLLRFAEAKPLGADGLRWLKIHLANICGYDKVSLDDREAFAMAHLDDIYDSADHPLDGKRWWLTSDDPWQCLATCFELAAALRSPNPVEFESSLPVHQDGTCNGLQHYAALGGDLVGAHQVNLDAGDRPSDVYSGVAKLVNEIIDEDAAKGDAIAQMLQGKVTRKVVKQTVMTTVYGVTFIGAKKQIEKQLKDRGDIPAEQLYQSSTYLGRLTLDSIGGLFKGASGIQSWLHKSARLIAKSIPPHRLAAAAQQPDVTGAPTKAKEAKRKTRIPKEQMTSVIWRTPLGLPVVQPYRKPKKRQVATALQTVFITDPSLPAEVDARAQATAFPPNFIHSLDATHMMMTALACKDRIAFASVHDSYWTHAATVSEMSTILRDAFIELHSQDILGNLRRDFLERYVGHVVPVRRVPNGLTSALSGSARSRAISSDKAAEEVISELEETDGEDDAALFARPAAPVTKRTRRMSGAGDGESNDDTVPLDDVLSLRRAPADFVYLADVIPPVPAKGEFDLSRIRNSLYFFS